MDKYHIFEFKTEELHEYTDKSEALKDFAKLREDDTPGIWQLFCNHQIIDEFIGGLGINNPNKDDDDFKINGVIIGSYWYDTQHEKMLFYTTLGKLTAEISMSPKQYKSICQSNPSLEGIWNALAKLFGDSTTANTNDEPKCHCPNGGDETDDCADCAYSPDYHLVGDDCIERTLENDKKKNMAYWDIIDDACYEAVRGVAASSQTGIDENELDEAVTEIGAEIRDIIVEKLKAIGGKFPFVDESY